MNGSPTYQTKFDRKVLIVYLTSKDLGACHPWMFRSDLYRVLGIRPGRDVRCQVSLLLYSVVSMARNPLFPLLSYSVVFRYLRNVQGVLYFKEQTPQKMSNNKMKLRTGLHPTWYQATGSGLLGLSAELKTSQGWKRSTRRSTSFNGMKLGTKLALKLFGVLVSFADWSHRTWVQAPSRKGKKKKKKKRLLGPPSHMVATRIFQGLSYYLTIVPAISVWSTLYRVSGLDKFCFVGQLR